MSEFAGFGPELIAFLEELRFNNEREWFQANKNRYEEDVREPSLAFVEAMAPRLEKISPQLQAVAKKSGGSLMRIYRDIRFSKDKTPYKTNLGIQFRHVTGKDAHAPGLYVHAEPGGVFLAAGTWRPAAEPLRKIRDAIDGNPDTWIAARDDNGFRERWNLSGESLSRAPRGFPKDHPMIEDIKRKDYIAIIEMDEEEILGAGFPDRAAAAFASATPFMRFLCQAIGVDY